ncbi:MAG: signal recognition particle-docking protein FtsY [Pseudomonadales bacterium]|nr:signal recognition particle-docking protein FtsY [Pseudomonadales bacterium]
MSDSDQGNSSSRWGQRMKSWFTGNDDLLDTHDPIPSLPAKENPIPAATQPELGVAPRTDSFFDRMKSGLSRTRESLASGLATVLIGGKEIDDELMEDIETQLIAADIGIEATHKVIQALTERVSRQELTHSHALYKALREELSKLLEPRVLPLKIDLQFKPFVILVVGVNGVGKTTTIGKMAKYFQNQNLSVMLAAGDTFRAAAVEQLTIWGERNQVPVVAQGSGADSASVIFDAMASARAKGIDVLIADTAGRLHNKGHLMEELRKVVRVMKKQDPQAPHEVMLVVDAGTGQNALNQVQDFNLAIPLTGLTVTKLDGTAKGGVLFNLATRWSIPIRYIGVGEQIEDLRPFKARDFVDALFQEE